MTYVSHLVSPSISASTSDSIRTRTICYYKLRLGPPTHRRGQLQLRLARRALQTTPSRYRLYPLTQSCGGWPGCFPSTSRLQLSWAPLCSHRSPYRVRGPGVRPESCCSCSGRTAAILTSLPLCLAFRYVDLDPRRGSPLHPRPEEDMTALQRADTFSARRALSSRAQDQAALLLGVYPTCSKTACRHE